MKCRIKVEHNEWRCWRRMQKAGTWDKQLGSHQCRRHCWRNVGGWRKTFVLDWVSGELCWEWIWRDTNGIRKTHQLGCHHIQLRDEKQQNWSGGDSAALRRGWEEHEERLSQIWLWFSGNTDEWEASWFSWLAILKWDGKYSSRKRFETERR